MRHAITLIVSCALLGCESVGPPEGGIWSKAPITGNGNQANPLTIPDGGITNGLLANSSITVMAGLGLTGGGMAELGAATAPLEVKFGTTKNTVTAGDDRRFADLRSEVDGLKVKPPSGSGDYIQNGVAPQNASFNVTGTGGVLGGLVVGGNAAPGPVLRVTEKQDAPTELGIINTNNSAKAYAGLYLFAPNGNGAGSFHLRRYPEMSDAMSDAGSKLAGTVLFTAGGVVSPFIFNPGAGGDYRFENGAKEAMRITSDGYIGIGTATPKYKLDVQTPVGQDSIAWRNPNSLLGILGVIGNTNTGVMQLYKDAVKGIDLRGDGTALKPGGGMWSDINSDRRLKKNIHTLTGALDNLLALRGVTFEWKDPGRQGGRHGPQIGLIAQEVESVFPDWVGTDEKGYKYITVRGLEALTVEGLRELNDRLSARNRALELRVASLESRLVALEERRLAARPRRSAAR